MKENWQPRSLPIQIYEGGQQVWHFSTTFTSSQSHVHCTVSSKQSVHIDDSKKSKQKPSHDMFRSLALLTSVENHCSIEINTVHVCAVTHERDVSRTCSPRFGLYGHIYSNRLEGNRFTRFMWVWPDWGYHRPEVKIAGFSSSYENFKTEAARLGNDPVSSLLPLSFFYRMYNDLQNYLSYT